MTNEFKQAVIAALNIQSAEKYHNGKYYTANEAVAPEKLEIKWTTGGMAGGSCWGDEPYEREPESEPEFEQLDELLTALCPAITFLQYKKLAQKLITRDSDHESSYYGNYYNYTIKRIDLNELEEYLREQKLWHG